MLHLRAEDGVQELVQWLRLGVETVGALIVALGVILAAILFIRALATRRLQRHSPDPIALPRATSRWL